MGLLDQFKAYIDANTPRNTRPAVSPKNVIYAGLLQQPVENIKANAAGLLGEIQRAPQDLAALASPQMYAKALKAMNTPQPVDKQKWIDAGMELSGMAPLGGFIAMTKAARPLTEYEIAHQVAQRNAAEMLGLPPNNTAMDRARAMGFDLDIPQYHGALNANQSALIPSRGGELGPGSYVTTAPELATEFARKSYGGEFPDGAGVFPLVTRNLETMPREKWVNLRGAEMDRLRAENGGEWNPDFYYQSMRNMAEGTEAKGNAGWYTPADGGANQGVVFDPKNIRSRFAAFDPARANESDLLAGLAPYIGVGGLLSLGLLGRDDQPMY